MSETCTVGQYLVDRLRQLGLEHLLSIAGDYSIDWLNNYVAPSIAPGLSRLPSWM